MTTQVSLEADLIARAAAGESAAISALYQANVKTVYRFIYFKVGSIQDAEDLTQDVLLAVFKSLASFRGDTSFRNWCFEIARNKIADHWRVHYKMSSVEIQDWLGVYTEMDQTEERLAELQSDQERVELIERFLTQLPDNYRQVLQHRFLKNYSIQETATALGLTVSNVKVLQHRALKKAASLPWPESSDPTSL